MSHAKHKQQRSYGVVGRRFLAAALSVAFSAGVIPAVAAAGVALPLAASASITQVASADTVGQDISKWQSYINIADLGSFVIVKAGGSDIGYYYTDPLYARNARAVRAAGKGLGHYYFNGYANPTDAANRFVNGLVEYRKGDPLVYDAEESQFVSPSKVQAWANQVRARLGSDANIYVYMSSSVTRSYNWSSVAASGAKLWVANYGSNNGAYHGSPSVGYWNTWTIHQYTSSGRVSGYSGLLDMNLAKSGAFGSGQTTSTVTIPTSVSSVPTGTYLGYSIAQTQRLLNAHGYHLAVDNSYGPATRAAVRDYQSKHGLVIDGYAGPATQARLSGNAAVAARTYRVVSGDTLSRIGAKTGIPWTTIANLNGIRTPYLIYTGQSLKLNGNASTRVTASHRTYTIRRGDTLSSIARKLGTSTSRLASLNGISNPNRIYTGHTIKY